MKTRFVRLLKFEQKWGMDLKLAGSVHPIDLVVFDCDGVLLDTMAAKIEAFGSWVPEAHAELREAFMAIVMAGFGRSRTYHIERFYRELLHQEPDPGFLDAEVARFTDICEPLCAGADWRVGSLEFVQACHDAEIPRYVLSGMPQQQLDELLASAEATDLFDVIIGSPPGKPESMERILTETDTPAHRAVFIGDANADHVAALHVGAHFVYFPSEAQRPEAAVATEVSDLRELLVETE
jgi:phosphoglycolate phosphatase-like HAD superfamily hydrolase